METRGEARLTPSQRLLEVIARTLRHEVGDLLQTVYSTVAILQERLPPEQTLERRLLVDLKGRAENCRGELDAVVDLVCPMNLTLGLVDLAELASSVATTYARRYPDKQVRCEASGPVPVRADARRLVQVLPLLVLSACQAAQNRVTVRAAAGPGPGEVELSVADDSLGVNHEQLLWLTEAFSTTHHAQFGLGLALARRVVGLHGGRVAADNLPEGGFAVRLILPATPSQV